jgi:hypothetical protein
VSSFDPVRPFTPLQVAVAFAIGGSILAVAIPTFLESSRTSRLAEPLEGLQRIAERASALAAGAPAELGYPESAPLTPARVPQGRRVLDPAGTWEHPTWRRLGFSWDVEHSYSFEFESRREPGRSLFVARAYGDLDGDGVQSRFEISGEIRDDGEPIVYPIRMYRETE